MNCLQCQSKITQYIEEKLTENEIKEFIAHVRECENCYEELDIYYTILIGTKYLDNDENLPSDFRLQLEERLHQDASMLLRRKRIKSSFFIIGIGTVIGILSVSGIFYNRHLYNLRQEELLSRQSTYYFKDNIEPFLFKPTGEHYKLDEPATEEDDYFTLVDEYLKEQEERDENDGQDTIN